MTELARKYNAECAAFYEARKASRTLSTNSTTTVASILSESLEVIVETPSARATPTAVLSTGTPSVNRLNQFKGESSPLRSINGQDEGAGASKSPTPISSSRRTNSFISETDSQLKVEGSVSGDESFSKASKGSKLSAFLSTREQDRLTPLLESVSQEKLDRATPAEREKLIKAMGEVLDMVDKDRMDNFEASGMTPWGPMYPKCNDFDFHYDKTTNTTYIYEHPREDSCAESIRKWKEDKISTVEEQERGRKAKEAAAKKKPVVEPRIRPPVVVKRKVEQIEEALRIPEDMRRLSMKLVDVVPGGTLVYDLLGGASGSTESDTEEQHLKMIHCKIDTEASLEGTIWWANNAELFKGKKDLLREALNELVLDQLLEMKLPREALQDDLDEGLYTFCVGNLGLESDENVERLEELLAKRCMIKMKDKAEVIYGYFIGLENHATARLGLDTSIFFNVMSALSLSEHKELMEPREEMYYDMYRVFNQAFNQKDFLAPLRAHVGGKQLYRIRALEDLVDADEFRVEYVDLGVEATIHISDIACMLSMAHVPSFLQKLPPQIFKARMKGLTDLSTAPYRHFHLGRSSSILIQLEETPHERNHYLGQVIIYRVPLDKKIETYAQMKEMESLNSYLESIDELDLSPVEIVHPKKRAVLPEESRRLHSRWRELDSAEPPASHLPADQVSYSVTKTMNLIKSRPMIPKELDTEEPPSDLPVDQVGDSVTTKAMNSIKTMPMIQEE